MDRQLTKAMQDTLCWLPERGWGWLAVRQACGKDYPEIYRRYAATPMGRAICGFRTALVNRYTRGPVVDVGIGCGQFVEVRNGQGHRTGGYDVQADALRWLRGRGWFVDPYAAPVEAITLWDVLEHIPEPEPLLAHVRSFVFVTLPIFADAAHVLRSKHFKRDEHCWYFTAAGLVRWFAGYGFRCLERREDETSLGREDIGTFVFERVRPGGEERP